MPSLVSIIIPCKNAAPWLADTIGSCLSQTWSAIEVIVVDNGSTDETLAIAQAMEGPKVRVVRCGKKGAAAARNAGLALARGDFVQFLDADDILDRDKIRVQMERLCHSPDGTIAACSWAQFSSNPLEAVFIPEPVWRDSLPGEFIICSWLGGGMMPLFAWLTPRFIIERAGPWNEELSLDDDGEYFTRVNLSSSGVVFCGDARGFYRKSRHPSLSSRKDRDALASGFLAAELSCRTVLEQCGSTAAARACACHFQRFIYYAYPDVPELVNAAEKRVGELGGTELKIGGGWAFRCLSTCFGWKFAKRSQSASRSVRTITLRAWRDVVDGRRNHI